MRVLRLFAVIAAVAVLPPITSMRAADRVHIQVWPAVAMAPTDLMVRVVIERHESNRWIRITADSEHYFGRSEEQVNGAQSSRLRIVQFRKVPAGEYELRAVVLDQNGRVAGAAQASALVR